jgi:hypothetical protein
MRSFITGLMSDKDRKKNGREHREEETELKKRDKKI